MANGLNYYNRTREERRLDEIAAEKKRLATRQTDFLLNRQPPPVDMNYQREVTLDEDVAKITVQILGNKAEAYFRQLRDWKPALGFEYFEKPKALDEMPHLGFAAITKGLIPERDGTTTPWIFYFANFNCRFGMEQELFVDIQKNYGLCFFALALTVGPDGQINGRDRRKRGNGLLFSTKDPNEAFETVAKLRQVQLAWAAQQKKKR